MRCPYCNHITDDDSMFCASCGRKIEPRGNTYQHTTEMPKMSLYEDDFDMEEERKGKSSSSSVPVIIAGIEGTVKSIQIFYTRMTTIDNKTIIVPNGILTDNSLTNVTARPERQLDLKVGIAYDADLKKAKGLIETMLLNDKDVIQDEEIKVFVDELADSSVVIGLRAWVKTEAYWTTRWRVLEEIKLQFDEAGIEIPFNQLTVHMKEGK